MHYPYSQVQYIREVCRRLNVRFSSMLSRYPFTYETTLDQLLVMRLVERLSHPLLYWLGVDAFVEYIGGKKQFNSSEIADILVVLENSVTNKTKVALVQSKRLYPKKTGISVSTKPLRNTIEAYEFSRKSVYGALSESKQQASMRKFIRDINKNVFYLFYNPWDIPMDVPVSPYMWFFDIPDCGMRVVPAEPVLNTMSSTDDAHSYADIERIFDTLPSKDKHGYDTEKGGWRFENWMADLFVGCKVGHPVDTDSLDAMVAGLANQDAPTILLKILTNNQDAISG